MTVRAYERRLACGAVVQNQAGEVLLVRLGGTSPGDPSTWALPSVEAEGWETSRQAAARAVHRRAALRVDPGPLAFAFEWREDGPSRGLAIWMLFLYHATARELVIDHRRDPEVLEVRWIPPDGAAVLLGSGVLAGALLDWLSSGMAALYEVTGGRPPGL
ncbi:MAG: NUDIX domain-containing protein [Bacillota bacterium]